MNLLKRISNHFKLVFFKFPKPEFDGQSLTVSLDRYRKPPHTIPNILAFLFPALTLIVSIMLNTPNEGPPVMFLLIAAGVVSAVFRLVVFGDFIDRRLANKISKEFKESMNSADFDNGSTRNSNSYHHAVIYLIANEDAKTELVRDFKFASDGKTLTVTPKYDVSFKKAFDGILEAGVVGELKKAPFDMNLVLEGDQYKKEFHEDRLKARNKAFKSFQN